MYLSRQFCSGPFCSGRDLYGLVNPPEENFVGITTHCQFRCNDTNKIGKRGDIFQRSSVLYFVRVRKSYISGVESSLYTLVHAS